MREIFQDNAVVLDNERFAGRFTDHFVDKLVVGIEEGFVGEEKKTLKERFKNYATNDTVWVEPKGEKPYLIDKLHAPDHLHQQRNQFYADRRRRKTGLP